MGHFGEIRLADPVFSAVVLPIDSAGSEAEDAQVCSEKGLHYLPRLDINEQSNRHLAWFISPVNRIWGSL